MILTTISIIVIAFFFPETKGRSLEELAELFGDPVVVHLDGSGKGDVEIEDVNIESKV